MRSLCENVRVCCDAFTSALVQYRTPQKGKNHHRYSTNVSRVVRMAYPAPKCSHKVNVIANSHSGNLFSSPAHCTTLTVRHKTQTFTKTNPMYKVKSFQKYRYLISRWPKLMQFRSFSQHTFLASVQNVWQETWRYYVNTIFRQNLTPFTFDDVW